MFGFDYAHALPYKKHINLLKITRSLNKNFAPSIEKHGEFDAHLCRVMFHMQNFLCTTLRVYV